MTKCQLIEKLKLIKEDCEQDASELDGKPFTGSTIGTQFGCTLAMINALAEVLDEVISRIEF